jgi:hypothetical protein
MVAGLHGFEWLHNNEIGEAVPTMELVGRTLNGEDPYNVHFTSGGPAFADWKPSRFLMLRWRKSGKSLSGSTIH